MQQKVSIIVACNSSGRSLVKTAKSRITATGFDFDPLLLTDKSHLAFYLNYIDVWSTEDTFQRFLYPKNKLKFISKNSTQIWIIDRSELQIRNKPRNKEEEFLHSVLLQAKSFYKMKDVDFYFLLVRSIFTSSTGFNPVAD
jgi:hypothetical protein